MQVAQYIFQSPSPSPVQVGRLDPSSKEDTTSSTETEQNDIQTKSAELIPNINTQDNTQKISSNQILDLYA